MRLTKLGEFNFINRISQGIKLSHEVVKGIGDDAAVFKYTKYKYLLFTTDMLVEGRHFYKNEKLELIGWKSLCCSVSDIAAMGGIPKFAVISVGLPGFLNVTDADSLYKGIKKAANIFNIDLVGGDTVSSKDIIINIALLGEVEKNNLVLRSGAKKNDGIFLTGNIGGSIKGRHLDFMPRLKEARFLVKNFKINSMIDISDGLLADLGHILDESRKGAMIYERCIPVSTNADDFNSAIREGEDFELIFTLPEEDACMLLKIWPFKTPLSKIGLICTDNRGFSIIRRNGKQEKVKPVGFTHF
jgi:thiamine-monophosphate kinase